MCSISSTFCSSTSTMTSPSRRPAIYADPSSSTNRTKVRFWISPVDLVNPYVYRNEETKKCFNLSLLFKKSKFLWSSVAKKKSTEESVHFLFKEINKLLWIHNFVASQDPLENNAKIKNLPVTKSQILHLLTWQVSMFVARFLEVSRLVYKLNKKLYT